MHSERIKWRTSINARPAEVEDRIEFGHWESDSVLGAPGSGGLHTTVERKSRYLQAVKIPAITAYDTLHAQLGVYSALPADAVRSVTADNGSEFAHHYRLVDTLAVPTYFADPYSAWQRGTNGHFNGRIRGRNVWRHPPDSVGWVSMQFTFDVTEVRQSADHLEDAFPDVANSGYASIADCGSALVAETVLLFVDKFKESVKSEIAFAERTAGSMQDCADDFNQVELMHIQQIRHFLEMLF